MGMGEEPTTVQNTLEEMGDFTVDEKSDNEIIVEEVKEAIKMRKYLMPFLMIVLKNMLKTTLMNRVS